MPSFCAVSTCEQKYSHSENVSFHKFPFRNPKLLAKWIKFTNRGATWRPSRWNSICSRHFDKSDFREYLSRKCLKRDAIPTIIMKSNISYETYHLSTGGATTTPEDTRTVNSEQDEYSGQMNDEGKMEASDIVEACRLCGEHADLTCNPLRSLDESEIELMLRKCLPAINLNGYLYQSRLICTDCVSQLKQYSSFIDKVYQREFNAAEHFDSFTTNENQHENATKFPMKPSTPNSNAALFIKQEPINVKQEKIDNSNRRSFGVQPPMASPSLCPNPFADSKKIKGSTQNDIKPSPPKQEIQNNSTYCGACDRIFGNCFECRTHKCTKSELQCAADRELGNNCEIMEVITINNPVSFIDLAEDEIATALESRPMKTESFSEEMRKERLEFEHAYAKRATHYSLKQEIIDSNIDCGESDYGGMETQNNENDLQPFCSNGNAEVDMANQNHFECTNCNHSFVSQELLDEHTTQMHYYPLKMKICPICNAEFKSSIEYLIHKNKVHAQRYQCRHCKRKFSTATILRSHERVCTRETEDFCFSCRHCGKILQNLAIMRKHLNSCAGKQRESTDEWQQQQSRKSSRSNVLRLKQIKQSNEMCVNNSNNAADQIAISSDASILTDTRTLNLNEKVNDDCNAVQSFKFIVDDSKFIFLNESNSTIPCTQANECAGLNGKFACDTCGTPFSTFVELKQHKRDVHDSERKFSCSLCPKTFKGISGLKQHISGYHYKIKPHLCSVCNYSYALKGDMQRCRHSKLRTPNNFKII